MAGTDSATQAIDALAQVYGMTAHHETVALIQVKHGFFEAKVGTFSNIRNTADFGWLLKKGLSTKKRGKNYPHRNSLPSLERL